MTPIDSSSAPVAADPAETGAVAGGPSAVLPWSPDRLATGATTPPAREERPISVETIEGAAAATLLADPQFQRAWDALYAACPWRTVYQQRAFAEAWFPLYGAEYVPVVTVAYEPDGRLAGLLVLAATKDRRRLHVAGAHQCEYQTWLALPDCGNAFIASALDSLRATFPAARLSFTYLAPGTPTAWCEAKGAGAVAQGHAARWASHVVVEPIARALRDLTGDANDASMRKKGNKSRLRQLARQGEVSFDHVTDPAEFRALLREFITVHEFRQGAVNGVFPFLDDPRKAEFHERLFAIPGFLHVTVLRAGGRLVAANLGIVDGESIAMGPHTFSPLFAKQSPGKLLMLLLADLAAAQGFQTLDMTPGPGWKERFATRADTCVTLHVFLRSRDRFALLAARRRDAVAKRIALAVGTTPDAVRAKIARARGLGLRGVVKSAVARVRGVPRFVRNQVTLDLYRMDPAAARAVECERVFKVNDLDDLLAFRPAEDWQTRQAFLSSAMDRIARGDRVYTRVEDGVLAAWGWLTFDQTKSVVPEVRQEIVLPPGSAVAYDFWTHPAHRGRGLHKQALRQALRDAGEAEGVTGVWMGVLASNTPARKNVEALGWPRHCRLRMESAFGRVARHTGKQPLHEQATWLSAARQSAKRGLLHLAKWGGGFEVARRLTSDELRILCYHGWELSGESEFAPRLFMKGGTFARRLDTLVAQRYRMIPLDQAVDGLASGNLPRLPVVITVDDGAASTALVAAKELASRQLPSTLYVTTYHVAKPGPVFRVALRYLLWKSAATTMDLAGVGPYAEGSLDLNSEGAVECVYWTLVRHAEEELDEAGRQALGQVIAEKLGMDWGEMVSSRRCSLLSPPELRALAEQGIDLQLHTHRHRFPVEQAAVEREIAENREALGAILPVRFDHLCYPSNEYDPAQFPWMQELGIRSATTCDVGLNKKGAHPYRLRRFLDGECVYQIEFEAEMSGFNDLARRLVRRVLRRAAE